MKKKLIYLTHGPMTKNEYKTFGVEYLKKCFDLSILEISPLINNKFFAFKRYFKFPIVKTFKELDKILSSKKNAMCLEMGFSYRSIKVGNILSKYNIKTISSDGIASLPTSRHFKKKKKIIFKHIVNRFFKLLFFNPIIFFNQFSFFVQAKLREIRYKNTDIALCGGNKCDDWNGYKKAKHKIYCTSLDYGIHLVEKKKKKFKNKKKFAVFIDTYLPFHPEHYNTFNKLINAEQYFKSLINFFKFFEEKTKLEIIIALYPKADITKYPKELKKFKIISNKTLKLIEASELVFHHGSTAQSFAVIYKKPSIFLTSNFMEKYKYVHDFSKRIDFMGSKSINIDKPDLELFKNKNYFSYYNKNLYKKYLGNYLRHKLSNNQTWFKNFNKYFNSEQVGNVNNK